MPTGWAGPTQCLQPSVGMFGQNIRIHKCLYMGGAEITLCKKKNERTQPRPHAPHAQVRGPAVHLQIRFGMG
eukprot:CAMPEP_0204561984 /NCGR_PEP_ID=MMETSP0661-20131031/33499_1 /ASSEMBLY_ACC=CAM_ASM_000606 /TAXON_ID=109239 /ORGANISM="Alexandrium margalefi, Strain AMGDE01CS-322" /LENGTH=71 /DNA_ID=CAMNT_0051569445 /DNA_START=11 /DNA_END=223 /DNA_ORIENTATION=-